MKKVIIALMVVGAVSVSTADLAVDFQNANVAVATPAGAPNWIPVGSMVQLVWSDTGISTSGGGNFAVLGGATLAGEFVLASTVTDAAFGGWSPVSGLYTAADVGGNDVNAGFFFTRIFEGTGSAGEFFVDVNAIASSAWVFDPLNGAGTTYQDNATGLSSGSVLNINQNNSTVIPEPATIGLMGVAGLGMFLARKKAHR